MPAKVCVAVATPSHTLATPLYDALKTQIIYKTGIYSVKMLKISKPQKKAKININTI